jgi:hypothetical protein
MSRSSSNPPKLTKAIAKPGDSADAKILPLRTVIFVFLVCGSLSVILAVHWPALSAKALSFDDNQYLIDNPLVKTPGWNSASRFLCEVLKPSTVGGYYQPLAMISLMLDYARGGSVENLRVFHQTSLLLHLLNTALVIFLIFQLFDTVWVAVAAGLLFGLHPMTVETIAWIGERKTVLTAFFSLLSLNFYIKYSHKGGWKFYFLTAAAYVLALMSKPTSTPLPILMLIMDYWPLRRFGKAAVKEKIPMFVIACISGAITIISQANTGIQFPSEYSLTAIPLMVCYSFIFYICKIFYPVHLSSHYSFPTPFSLSQPMILTAVICMIVLTAAVAISVRWTRAFLAGMLFFLIAILPTMQIIGFSNVIASDKFAYIPAVGLLISGAYLLIQFWNWSGHNKLKWLCRIGISAVLLFAADREAVATRNYLVHWQNTEGLCSYMIGLSPDVPELYNLLGTFYYQNGNANKEGLDKAAMAFRKALTLRPGYDYAHYNLGNVLLAQNKINEAAAHFSQAVKLRPDFVNAMNNLALLIATVPEINNRDVNEAILLANRACELTHYKNPTLVGTLAAAYAAAGRFPEAVNAAKSAITLANAAHQQELKDTITYQLQLYTHNRPYIESPNSAVLNPEKP